MVKKSGKGVSVVLMAKLNPKTGKMGKPEYYAVASPNRAPAEGKAKKKAKSVKKKRRRS